MLSVLVTILLLIPVASFIFLLWAVRQVLRRWDKMLQEGLKFDIPDDPAENGVFYEDRQ